MKRLNGDAGLPTNIVDNLVGTVWVDPSKKATPHVIHYCWFGYGELSDAAKRALASWKKYAPEFEIRRCDESNFDVDSCNWVQGAYAAKKYAFVADYARFRLLYDYGGAYMDLGSKLVKDITPLVETCSPFSAIEELTRTAATGLIAVAPPHDSVIASVLSRYESMTFSDDIEFLKSNTVNEIFTSELEKQGFVREDRFQKAGEWTLLPSPCFNPVYGLGGYHIKRDTYSTHSNTASWFGPKYKTKQKVETRLAPFVGRRAAQIIGRIASEIKHEGIGSGLKNLTLITRDCVGRGFEK